jgi:aspartyl-tRNA(Asn)/glutamyl-tRNA(Gln) amidotransferase subunit C
MNHADAKQGKMPLRAGNRQSGMVDRKRGKTRHFLCALAAWSRIDDALSIPDSPFPIPGFIMPIDPATVRRIARLARLSVDDAHVASAAAELDGVLQMADALRQADLDGVEPLAHPHEQALALRDDAVTEADRADAFLALAPESRGGLYLVPKVIE